MKCMATMAVLAILAGACVAAEEVSAGTDRRPPTVGPGRPVDLAICLDTSGSMRGLIESAKQKLWAVVNELATAKPRPVLRVGLYHYGNSGLDSRTGWVLKLCDLTDDLDTVYSKLFALRTSGGTEYVARVVRAATNELDWNADKGTLRIIFVAGNEAATQDGKYKLRDICAAAAGKGIIVNTIFCGPDARGRSTGWADAARWADGQYASIDQNRGTLVVNTPYDKELSELGVRLNATYIGYGKGGAAGLANQAKQDANARS
ncbi:MAG: vWA domain-containing protein, partial [Planctomycetota bacterium]